MVQVTGYSHGQSDLLGSHSQGYRLDSHGEGDRSDNMEQSWSG